MHPILIQFGFITIHTLWLSVVAGIIVGSLLIHQLSIKSRTKLKLIFNHLALITITTIVSSRILYLIFNWQQYLANIDSNNFRFIFYIWDRGLSAWGAIIGVIISTIIISRKYKEDFIAWFDRIIIALIASSIFINIGAFFEGINYGNETDLPWGFTFESGKIKYAVPIHPTQLYTAIYATIITLLLYHLHKSKFANTPGNLTKLGIILYSFGEFILGFFRGSDTYILWELRIGQWLSLIAFIVTAGIWIYQHQKKSPTASSPASK